MVVLPSRKSVGSSCGPATLIYDTDVGRRQYFADVVDTWPVGAKNCLAGPIVHCSELATKPQRRKRSATSPDPGGKNKLNELVFQANEHVRNGLALLLKDLVATMPQQRALAAHGLATALGGRDGTFGA